MKKNTPITDVERNYSADANLLSTTDLKGAITYANDDFIEVSGFELDELLGKNHNIVRHPEMPPEAFSDLWQTIKSGKSWMGLVKNRCKNGDYYWVDAYVKPILSGGKVTEYQSVRRKPELGQVERAKSLYEDLLNGKVPKWWSKISLGIRGKLILATLTAQIVTVAILYLSGRFTVSEAALFVGFAGILSSLSIHFLTRRLDQAVTKARSIVDNKIAQYVYTGSCDDIGQILLALKMQSSESGAIVGRMADSAGTISKEAESLAQTIDLSHESIHQQHVETDQVARAISEMITSNSQVIDYMHKTSNATQHADTEAKAGQIVVEQTVEAITNIAQGVTQATRVIRSLEDNSKEISAILVTIQNIAEQTNLLALNAAIEAARAGDQGRGFAVVADEVRTLALKSNESAQEIQSMIEKLQQGSLDAVEVMNLSREQADRGVEQVTKATQSLAAITDAIDSIADMSFQVATAIEQQGEAAKEIDNSVASIRQTSEINLFGIGKSRQISLYMTELAQSLDDLALQFWNKGQSGKKAKSHRVTPPASQATVKSTAINTDSSAELWTLED